MINYGPGNAGAPFNLTSGVYFMRLILFNSFITDYRGGAVFLQNGVDLSVYNSLFVNCSAIYGGGIYSDGINSRMYHCCFESCTVTFQGSAVYSASKNLTYFLYCSSLFSQKYYDSGWSNDFIMHGSFYKDTNCMNCTSSKFVGICGLLHSDSFHSKISFLNTHLCTAYSALSLYKIAIVGDHSFANLINNTCTQGTIYCQNTTTTIRNFIIIDSGSKIIYNTGGNCYLTLENCILSIPAQETEMVCQSCQFNHVERTMHSFSLLSKMKCLITYDSTKTSFRSSTRILYSLFVFIF